MNKKLLTYCLLFCLMSPSLALQGQSLTGSTADGEVTTTIMESVLPSDFEVVAKSFVRNNTGDRYTLNWKRVKNELTEGWISLVCDPITCWGPVTSENPDPIVVNSNETMLLDIHVQPNGVEGMGTVDIHVWAEEDSSNVNITMTYLINAVVDNIDDNPINNVKLYPNPVRSNLTLDIGTTTDIRYVEIYSLIGRKMAHYTVPSNTDIYRVNASALPEGMYFVKMLDKNFQQLGTKTFAKD